MSVFIVKFETKYAGNWVSDTYYTSEVEAQEYIDTLSIGGAKVTIQLLNPPVKPDPVDEVIDKVLAKNESLYHRLG